MVQTRATHFRLVLRRNLGALPSRAIAWRLREAPKVYALPAEMIVVSRAAVTIDGSTLIPRFFIEMMLGVSTEVTGRDVTHYGEPPA